MYNQWGKDLKDSILAIESIRDTILPDLISGEIISIENVNNDILILLDQCCGVGYIRKDENGLQGIASRVQFGYNFDSFTIRYSRHTGNKTEFEKRVFQIKNGYFYPAFTMQAYFNNRENLNLKSIAIIKTVDLYDIIEKTPDILRERKSDNVFKYINWCDIDKKLIKIHKQQ